MRERTKEEMRDYMDKYRFGALVQKMKEDNIICKICKDRLAATLHHKNEDHNDNRGNNLLPVCRQCHLEVYHVREVEYSKEQIKSHLEAPAPPQRAPKEKNEVSERLKIDGCYIFLHNPNTRIRIKAWISLKTRNLLETLGFEQEKEAF